MGVDYSANFGIGFKLVRKEFEEGHEFEGDFHGYIDHKLEGTVYGYFSVGSEMYTDDENDFYVILDNPFENGIDGLRQKTNELIDFLDGNDIEYDGEIDVVGGLEIY